MRDYIPCKTRAHFLRLLIRHQQVLLQKAKYQRCLVEKFDHWYQNGPAKQVLEQVQSYADRIEQLGRAIFGDDWRPELHEDDFIILGSNLPNRIRADLSRFQNRPPPINTQL